MRKVKSHDWQFYMTEKKPFQLSKFLFFACLLFAIFYLVLADKFFFNFSGVLSGHELLSYSFLGGQACEPRRSVRRKHRYRSSMSLPRSSSRRSSFKFSSLKYMLPGSQKKIKEHDNSDNNSGTPDSELDSGISINGHYDNIDQLQRKNGLRCDYDRIDEIKTMTGTYFKTFGDICQSQNYWPICPKLQAHLHNCKQCNPPRFCTTNFLLFICQWL